MNRLALISLAGFLLSGAGILLLHLMLHKIPKLIGLSLFYLGGSVLLLNVCSFQMCAAMFVCGIGVTVLFWTVGREDIIRSGPIADTRIVILFRLILAVILGILSFTITDLIRFWMPVSRSILFICVWAFLMGITGLAMDDALLYRCVFLQSLCVAFTICYVYMENSVLVFSFFAAINLLMSFGSSVLVLGTVHMNESNLEDIS